MNKTELSTQTRLAFDFIQKLYFEVSYLIKEVEGLLSEENEEFVMGRGSGYAVTARSSSGLDPSFVNFWMYKKVAAFFVPKSFTKIEGGQTITRIEYNPKIIYMRIVLHDKGLSEPIIHYGLLKDFIKKGKSWPVKIEQVMGHIEYNETKVFSSDDNIDYEDGYLSFKGKLSQINLYDINTSQDVVDKLITPVLIQFRSTN